MTKIVKILKKEKKVRQNINLINKCLVTLQYQASGQA